MALTIDVHQHLLGPELIEELERRTAAPSLVRRDEGWTFRVAGEPDSVLAPAAVDVEVRGAELAADGVDLALVALSTALGIETLPAAESAPLIEAHHRGIEALPDGFGGWGAVQLEVPDPADVDAALDRGCVGIALPATALAHPAALAAVGPLLERLELRGAPLFVHPGPVARGGAAFGGAGRPASGPAAAGAATSTALGLFGRASTGDDTPLWWPALTDYVAQMQAAWFAFLAAGHSERPRLRVLFAMLAGGAPLHLERYAARGGSPIPEPDPLVFYDTSSYGPRMIAALRDAVGASQLVYGSDRPVVDPAPAWPDPELRVAALATNPSRLLDPDPKGALA